MAKRTSVLVILILSLFVLQCKIIEFDEEDIFVTVTIEKNYPISSNSSSFSESETINLAAEYSDAGVDPEEIDSVYITTMEVNITENSTGSNTTATGAISFTVNGGSDIALATFSNVNLNDVLNVPITPFSVLSQLTMVSAGVTQFTNAVQQIPPPTLTFYINGTVNQPPVNFKANLKVVIQLKLQP
jgi:hypothetical protein